MNVDLMGNMELLNYVDILFGERNVKLYGEKAIWVAVGRVLTGEAFALKCSTEDNVMGLCIFRVIGAKRDVFEFLQMHAKNNIRACIDAFIQWAKGRGFVKLVGTTAANPEAMCRLLGTKIVYSYLEKEL